MLRVKLINKNFKLLAIDNYDPILVLLIIISLFLIIPGQGYSQESTTTPVPEYIIGAHYYPWFDPSIPGSWGECERALEPVLGYYDVGNKEVAEQHIRWAKKFGIDVFAVVWIGRQDGQGCVRSEEFCTRGENKIFSGLLKASNLNEIKFCIHYDVQNRMSPGWCFSYNFNDPIIFNKFVEDFEYLADRYFDHPSYFKINGRPVVWVLFTHFFKGDFERAFLEARDRVRAKGYDVYIVGDAIWWGEPNKKLIQCLDAVSSYNLYFSLPGVGSLFMGEDTSEFVDKLRNVYQQWREVVTKTKVVGSKNYVDFQPGIIPRIWRDFMDYHPLFALPLESKEGFLKMAEMAQDLSEPALDTNLNIVWITSWNEWCERTAIEPTKAIEPNYPFGNLGFELLEVIKEVFGE